MRERNVTGLLFVAVMTLGILIGHETTADPAPTDPDTFPTRYAQCVMAARSACEHRADIEAPLVMFTDCVVLICAAEE